MWHEGTLTPPKDKKGIVQATKYVSFWEWRGEKIRKDKEEKKKVKKMKGSAKIEIEEMDEKEMN